AEKVFETCRPAGRAPAGGAAPAGRQPEHSTAGVRGARCRRADRLAVGRTSGAGDGATVAACGRRAEAHGHHPDQRL
ncbi:MAG: hypothetical protein AVDCRST_MAG67-3785, partial [uncultured Solirubrobacteraceae bacterium]